MTNDPGMHSQPGMPPPPPPNLAPPPPPPPPVSSTPRVSSTPHDAPPPAHTGARHHPQLPATVTITTPWGRLGAYFLEGLLVIVTLGIGWLIWAAMIAGNGQTPAKRLLQQRVIHADTMRPASFARMFWVRGLLAGFVAGFAILFTLGIILFMPFWDKRNQNVWDKVSNTYVVNDPNDAWGRIG